MNLVELIEFLFLSKFEICNSGTFPRPPPHFLKNIFLIWLSRDAKFTSLISIQFAANDSFRSRNLIHETIAIFSIALIEVLSFTGHIFLQNVYLLKLLLVDFATNAVFYKQ